MDMPKPEEQVEVAVAAEEVEAEEKDEVVVEGGEVEVLEEIKEEVEVEEIISYSEVVTRERYVNYHRLTRSCQSYTRGH